MGGLAYSYTYAEKNAIDNTLFYRGQTATQQVFVSAITTPTGTTQITTEPADGIDTRAVTYTPQELAQGYEAYSSNSYPPPGKPMWTNYRITIKDHTQAPTEYYFCGFDSARYIRGPLEMKRAAGLVKPRSGGRTEMSSTLVGGKGEIDQTLVFVDANTPGSDPVQISRNYSYGYNSTTREATYVDNGNGGSHYMVYNSKGKPTRIDIDDGSGDQTINIAYMPNGLDVDTVKRNWLGVEKTLTDYNYYPNRDLQSVTDVNGRTISYQWTANGLPQQISDSVTGDVITFGYDAKLRPTTVSINGNIVSTSAFDTAGKGVLTAVLSVDGRLSSYEYDNLNRLTRERNSDDSFTAYQWACCYIEMIRTGKIVGGVEKTLEKSTTAHDSRALPKFTTGSDGLTTAYVYDEAGRMTKLVDPKGQTTEWKFNTAGQLLEKIYPDQTKDKFDYVKSGYGMGQPASITNRRNQTTSLSYAYDGLPSAVTRPAGEGNTTYNYDSWRRVSSIVQGSGFGAAAGTHTFTYDLLGRTTSLDGPWVDDTLAFSYNDAARSVIRTSPGGMTQTNTSDAYGRLASTSNALGTFSNTYNGLGGQLTQITHTGANAGFNTAFTYHGDAFDRALASITSTLPAGTIVGKHSYTYNDRGNITMWKREAPLANPTGPTRQFDSSIYYDASDQLTSVINKPLAGSSVEILGHHFTYDKAGNMGSRQVETSASGSNMTTYSHNRMNQITGIGGIGGTETVRLRGETNEPATVKVKPASSGTWKDSRMLSENRFEADLGLSTGANQINVQAKDGSNNIANYTYGLNLAAAPSASPTFDADGNMLTDGIRSYEWDSQSRLVKVSWGSGSNQSTEFLYNSLGQRSEQIEKTGTAETSHHYLVYDGIQRIARFNGGTATANLDQQYFSQGERRKVSGAWESSYYNRDHLGSIREVVKSDGSLQARYDYDPYGKRRTQYLASTYTGGCTLGYTGLITLNSPAAGQSEQLLTHFRAYDPELGRWLSADPIGEAGGMNLYGYASNSPTNLVDILGLYAGTATWGAMETASGGSWLAGLANAARAAAASTVTASSAMVASAAALGYASWQLGLESVELEKSLAQLERVKEDSRRLDNLLSSISDSAGESCPVGAGPNDRHGDGGRALSKAQKQLEALREKLAKATGAERTKLKNKIQKIKEAAQRKKKGEEHGRKTKKK